MIVGGWTFKAKNINNNRLLNSEYTLLLFYSFLLWVENDKTPGTTTGFLVLVYTDRLRRWSASQMGSMMIKKIK